MSDVPPVGEEVCVTHHRHNCPICFGGGYDGDGDRVTPPEREYPTRESEPPRPALPKKPGDELKPAATTALSIGVLTFGAVAYSLGFAMVALSPAVLLPIAVAVIFILLGVKISHAADIRLRRAIVLGKHQGVLTVEVNEKEKPWPELAEHTFHWRQKVTRYSSEIEAAAMRYSVDPDLIRAVMYVENVYGAKDIVSEFFGMDQSIQPMNVHSGVWKDLGLNRKKLQDPATNIDAGANILSLIWSHTASPTVEKVATLYNKMGANNTNKYGATVSSVYRRKPWVKK